jgi:hypothetical protein
VQINRILDLQDRDRLNAFLVRQPVQSTTAGPQHRRTRALAVTTRCLQRLPLRWSY